MGVFLETAGPAGGDLPPAGPAAGDGQGNGESLVPKRDEQPALVEPE